MITLARPTHPQARPGAAAPARYSRAGLWPAALLMLGAAAIPFAVVPDHLAEYLPFGVFFLLLGGGQVALAAATLLRPRRALFAGGAGGTLAVLLLWAVSRTGGLPFGPDPGQPEMIGFADLCVVLLEGSALALFAVLARGPRPLRARRRGFWPAVRATVRITTQLTALLLILALTLVGVLSGANGMVRAVNVSAPVADRPAVSLTSLTQPPGTEPVKSFTLTAQVAQIDGQAAWTYNGTVPGPELRVTQGDRVRVTLVNHLPAATTIHWHGLRLPNAEDGVAGITQDAVPPGHTFTYEFVVQDAGTYWYHPHQDTETQLDRGLFGALVVAPRGGPAADRDYVVLLHKPPGGQGVAINGSGGPQQLVARPGESVRLRLINAVAPGMDGGPQTPALIGAQARVVALDGQDLTGPQLLGPTRLPLGMGQRADLLFTMPLTGGVRLVDSAVQGAPSPVEQVFAALAGPPPPPPSVTFGSGPIPVAGDLASLPLFDPTRYGTPAADPVAAAPADATYPVVLNKAPGFRDGRIELLHTINGQVSPQVPPIIVHPGEIVRLHIVNQTEEYHPMHLHGHTLVVVAKDGRPLAGSPLHLDTLLVGPHETWDVAFRADNPGLWMFHCHVLLHASAGMTMMVDYAGITTPFDMGTQSGNMPE